MQTRAQRLSQTECHSLLPAPPPPPNTALHTPGRSAPPPGPYSGHFLLLCLGGPGLESDSDSDLSPLPPGKSALHWAAAVNNVEATLALLKNGANKDMQDSKVSPSRWPTGGGGVGGLPWHTLPPTGSQRVGCGRVVRAFTLPAASLQGWGLGPRGSNCRSERKVCGSC